MCCMCASIISTRISTRIKHTYTYLHTCVYYVHTFIVIYIFYMFTNLHTCIWMSVPDSFKTGPSVWCLYSTNTRHKADRKPLDTMGLYWMVLASAETWSAEIKYLEPKWPLFLKVNPAKQGLFKPKQGAPFGFQVPIVFCWTWFTDTFPTTWFS